MATKIKNTTKTFASQKPYPVTEPLMNANPHPTGWPNEQTAGLRYDPSTNRHNGLQLKRGDVLLGKNGKHYSLDRNNGYILSADELDDKKNPTNKSVSFSVDPTDKERFFDVQHTGQNVFDFDNTGQKNLFNARYAQLVRNVSQALLAARTPPAAVKLVLNALATDTAYLLNCSDLKLDDDIAVASGLSPRLGFKLFNSVVDRWARQRVDVVKNSNPHPVGWPNEREHGVSQTETPEFKKWFGDSKVVDKHKDIRW